jgi:hypothetical protein
MGGFLGRNEHLPASIGMTKFGVQHKEMAQCLFPVLNTSEAELQSLMPAKKKSFSLVMLNLFQTGATLTQKAVILLNLIK